MRYRGYTIKKVPDGSYSVWIDDIEDMEDLPSEEAAKAFIDGKFSDYVSELSDYAPKVKHLTRNQVDNYVYYDPYDFIDTDNVYQLSYQTKRDRIQGLSKVKKAGFKLVDTTDNDEGRYPFWAFVSKSPSELDESVEYDDQDVKKYLDEYGGIKSDNELVKYIISNLADFHDEDYYNIYVATEDPEISSQYSYNIVFSGIKEILHSVVYPIIKNAMNKELDPLDELNEAIYDDSDLRSELSYIDDLVSEYGDARRDIDGSSGETDYDREAYYWDSLSDDSRLKD